MLTDDEYEDVVRRHQGAPAPYPREKTLHELFAEQAARTPGQTAVVDGASGATLTFAELDRRADQVARALSERGAGPGDRVAILAERGPELLPGLLGILKAGAAYVPVDPGYPPSRVRLLLEDCGAKLVLRGAREVEVPSTGAPVLRISELYRGNGRPLGRTAGPRDVAYTIYTSGSTGRPKGVMVEHHAVVNRLTWMQRRYPVGPGDTLLQKTPISFDVSVWELLWWAVQGAAVVLLPPGAEKDPERIARTVRDHRISVVHFVPSMLGPFLDLLEDHPERAAGAGSLRYVFCSGEALPPERATQFNRIFDGDDPPRLVNLYGPTEAAVDVTYFDCPPASEGPVTRVPIGRPVENTTLYVLCLLYTARPAGPPAAGRRPRRTAHRRGPGRPRLPRAARAHRRAVRRGPLRPRRPPLPHRGPGPAAERRQPGVPRPQRRPGQDPRQPGRAGRGAERAGRAGRDPRRRGRRPPARRRPGPGPRRLLHGRPGPRPGRPASGARDRAARLHDPVVLRTPGQPPPHAQRQGGPQGPARPVHRCGRGCGQRAPHPCGEGARGHLGTGARRRPGRRPHGLLRDRRRLDQHAPGPGARREGRHPVHHRRLRPQPHRGGAGRPRRGGPAHRPGRHRDPRPVRPGLPGGPGPPGGVRGRLPGHPPPARPAVPQP